MRDIKALIIEPNGTCRIESIPHAEAPDGLKKRNQLVGGPIEYVAIPSPPNESTFFYVNEKSKHTIGPPGYNRIATQLARGYIQADDWICGAAIVLKIGLGGHDLNAPQWVIDKVKSMPECVWTE